MTRTDESVKREAGSGKPEAGSRKRETGSRLPALVSSYSVSLKPLRYSRRSRSLALVAFVIRIFSAS